VARDEEDEEDGDGDGGWCVLTGSSVDDDEDEAVVRRASRG